MNNFKNTIASLNNYGKMTILLGLLVLAPIIVIPFYPEESLYYSAFIIPAVAVIIIGGVICIFAPKSDTSTFWDLNMRRSVLIVLYGWFTSFFVGAVPFVLANQLTPLRALFETVSAYTTTGLSVLKIAEAPHVILFHRALMQFCGIFGFTIMIILIAQDKQSMNLFNVEGHTDQLMPNVRRTSTTILRIYSVLCLIGIIGFRILGLPLFDSICHSMSSLATGGFSTKPNNFIDIPSVAIRLWSCFIMILGTINTLVILMISQGKIKRVLKISEFRFMWILLAGFIILNTYSFIHSAGMGLGDAFVHGTYNIVTSLSTAGNAIDYYSAVPPIVLSSSIICMIMGGMVGSTSGGLKLARVYLLYKMIVGNIKKRMAPSRNVSSMKYTGPQGKVTITDEMIKDSVSYIALYFVVLIIGTTLLMLVNDCTLSEGLFEFTSSLSGVGLSIGLTGPTTNAPTLIIEMVGMILGRLEIFTVLIGGYYIFTNIRHKLQK